MHCFGGFVIAQMYDLARVTADLDVVEARGVDLTTIAKLAGKGSELHLRHKVYVDVVTVASVPDGYQDRLLDLFPREFRNLQLKAFERHDLVLAKLGRNIDRDREDVKRLTAGPGLDPEVLRRRYDRELRYQFGRPEREDLTLDLWLAMIQEVHERLKH